MHPDVYCLFMRSERGFRIYLIAFLINSIDRDFILPPLEWHLILIVAHRVKSAVKTRAEFI